MQATIIMVVVTMVIAKRVTTGTTTASTVKVKPAPDIVASSGSEYTSRQEQCNRKKLKQRLYIGLLCYFSTVICIFAFSPSHLLQLFVLSGCASQELLHRLSFRRMHNSNKTVKSTVFIKCIIVLV